MAKRIRPTLTHEQARSLSILLQNTCNLMDSSELEATLFEAWKRIDRAAGWEAYKDYELRWVRGD